MLDSLDATKNRGPRIVQKILESKMDEENKKYWLAHEHIVSVDILNILTGEITIIVDNKQKAKPVIDAMKRNLISVQHVLKQFGWKKIKISVIRPTIEQ